MARRLGGRHRLAEGEPGGRGPQLPEDVVNCEKDARIVGGPRVAEIALLMHLLLEDLPHGPARPFTCC